MGTSLTADLNQLRLGDRIRVHRKPILQSSRGRIMNSRGPVLSPQPKIMRAGVLEGIVIELHRFGKHPRMLIRRTDLSKPQDVFISLDHNDLLSIEHIQEGRVHMVHIKPIRKYRPSPLQNQLEHTSTKSSRIPSALSTLKLSGRTKEAYLPLLSNK